jgi:hypothetical protein
MTPKEKAEELFNKMDMVVGGGNYDAKEYASIAVDEILNLDIDTNILDYWYWQEVKTEIEKL